MTRPAAKLRTRQPTGQVAYPLIVVEGAEKVGKSYTSFSLSASPRVGNTYVFDMGEGSGDEYASLGPYQLVEHDGTWTDFIAQVELAATLPADGGPTVIVIDSASMVWQLLKDWGELRARRGKKARELLKRDPDAEISIPMNIWTDIADRWGRMIHALTTNPVIGILICRGKEVSKVGPDGQPVKGETEYKIEGHKSTLFAATAHVRCLAPGQTRLMSARSLHADIPRGGLQLPAEQPLEHVIFDVLAAGETFQVSPAIAPNPDEGPRTVATAKQDLVSKLKRAEHPDPTGAAKQIWRDTPGLPKGAGNPVNDDQWAALSDAAATAITELAAAEPA